MDNITMAVDRKGVLTITIDTTKEGRPSSSGRSQVIATTRGNVKVPGTGGKSGVDCKLGLNLYR